jgi:hypothetical protein
MSGEELTFDYQFERFGNKKQRCLCGSKNCCEWIGGKPKKQEERVVRLNHLELFDRYLIFKGNFVVHRATSTSPRVVHVHLMPTYPYLRYLRAKILVGQITRGPQTQRPSSHPHQCNRLLCGVDLLKRSYFENGKRRYKGQ